MEKEQVKYVDIYEEMAVLWTKQNGVGLTEQEGERLDQLLRMNADRHWDRIRITQMEELACITGDKEWSDTLAAERDYRNL